MSAFKEQNYLQVFYKVVYPQLYNNSVYTTNKYNSEVTQSVDYWL